MILILLMVWFVENAAGSLIDIVHGSLILLGI